MMELKDVGVKDVVMITKPIDGIYGARIKFQGTEEKQREFNQVCRGIKQDAGLMQSNDTTYEFLHQNEESVRLTAFQVAEKLNIPVLFF